MTILHAMSISGSIAVIVYILLHYFTQKYLPVLWHKIYLTITIFLFIIPFPYIGVFQNIKGWFNDHLELERLKQNTSILYNKSHYTIIKFNNGIYVHNLWLYIIIFMCLLLSVYFLIKLIIKYVKIYRLLKNISNKYEDANTNTALNLLSQKVDVPPNIKVYLCNGLETPITIGIIRGKVILPNIKWENNQLADALHHEIIHIMVKDNLIKLILLMVVLINFYNPLVYYLLYKWSIIAEMYCDNKVIEDKSEQEIKDYANLIIDFAEGTKNTNLPVVGLSINKKQMKERIMNMKRTRKNYGTISKLIGTTIILFAVLASSLSVLAYTPRNVIHYDENYEGGEIETLFLIGDGAYPDERSARLREYESYINDDNVTFFIDEDGNVYYDIDIENNYQSYAVCNHEYVAGTLIKHTKYSNGGCKIDFYDGKQCNKCGYTIYESHIVTYSYDVCTH